VDFFRLWRTVKFLKPLQVYSRIWFRLVSPRPETGPPPGIRQRNGAWKEPVKKYDNCLGKWRFRFLNEEHECSFPQDWNRETFGKLWLYNLHYFDLLSAGEIGREQADELIGLWVAGNPPGEGNGWEPYPLSLRIVNWIKWALAGNELLPEAQHSLAVQVRYLRKRLEYHLLGNHLFANGKALIFAGLFFVGAEAEGWLKKGLEILGRELVEQILPDGGHFERSPMYHAIIFEDILDLINLFQAYGKEVPPGWCGTAGNMANWLVVMSHPDGDVALFNDAALKIAARPETLFAYYEKVIGSRVGSAWSKPCVSLPASGYFVMKPRAGDRLLVDCGNIGPDYLPGHAHCDTLSFELSLQGKRVVVDSGCGIYVDGEMRHYNRGNQGHNVVTVDGVNQSEVWGAHRCGRRARPLAPSLVQDGDCLRFTGAHDGYCFLPGKPLHRREVCWEGNQIVVEDLLVGDGRHRLEGRLHLHPDLPVAFAADQVTVDLGDKTRLVVRGLHDNQVSLEDGWYCPEFGKFIVCPVLVWQNDLARLPFRGGFSLTIESEA